MKALFISFWILFLCSSCVLNKPGPTHKETTQSYPQIWWASIAKGEQKNWEISPSSVSPPIVIISKRNELGILSNFAATRFSLDGKSYESMEGFWQSMKYPESSSDPRMALIQWPYTRNQVENLSSFDAKKAGDLASQVMKKHKIDWVSYNGQKMIYKELLKGQFYKVIRSGMMAKLLQNPEVLKVLCKTQGLILKPDHNQGPNSPPAWKYHEIWMEIREQQCSI